MKINAINRSNIKFNFTFRFYEGIGMVIVDCNKYEKGKKSPMFYDSQNNVYESLVTFITYHDIPMWKYNRLSMYLKKADIDTTTQLNEKEKLRFNEVLNRVLNSATIDREDAELIAFGGMLYKESELAELPECKFTSRSAINSAKNRYGSANFEDLNNLLGADNNTSLRIEYIDNKGKYYPSVKEIMKKLGIKSYMTEKQMETRVFDEGGMPLYE